MTVPRASREHRMGSRGRPNGHPAGILWVSRMGMPCDIPWVGIPQVSHEHSFGILLASRWRFMGYRGHAMGIPRASGGHLAG